MIDYCSLQSKQLFERVACMQTVSSFSKYKLRMSANQCRILYFLSCFMVREANHIWVHITDLEHEILNWFTDRLQEQKFVCSAGYEREAWKKNFQSWGFKLMTSVILVHQLRLGATIGRAGHLRGSSMPLWTGLFKGVLNLTLGSRKNQSSNCFFKIRITDHTKHCSNVFKKNVLIPNLQIKFVSVCLETRPWVKY